MPTYTTPTTLQEPQLLQQPVLDFGIPMNEDDSASEQYPSFYIENIQLENDGIPSIDFNHEGNNNNSFVVYDNRASGNHYSVPNYERYKV